MSDLPDDRREADPATEAFVRRVNEAYAPPPLTPARRVAFHARLDERLERGARPRWGARLAAAGAVAAACVLTLRLASDGRLAVPLVPPPVVPTATTIASPDEALLVLATESETSDEETLPADYEAISSVFLGT